MSDKIRRFALATIILHVLISAPHALAHQMLGVHLSLPGNLFVLVVILTLPIVAGGLLWKKVYRAGGALLGGSMLGSLFFGLYYHFIAINPDHVSQAPAGLWGTMFRWTAVLLFASEALGTLAGVWVLKRNLWPVGGDWSPKRGKPRSGLSGS